MLFSSERGRRPGPKGPAKELIDAVVAMKGRNPTWGCPRIAQQITWLILEPIFEADFQPGSFGYRPKKSAHAALRNRKFFSIEELNHAIRELRDRINQRPFRKREGSRATQFVAVDKPAMGPLPAERFDLSEWSRAR
jgi:hypothetical protein